MATYEAGSVISTAVAPALHHRLETEAPPAPLLRGDSGSSGQPSLFAHEKSSKVVSMRPYIGGDAPPPGPPQAPPSGWAEQHHPASKKRQGNPGQTSFDFNSSAAPTKPLSREMDRRKDFPVASMKLRALGASIDLGVMVLCAALFLLTVRLCLGPLPEGTAFYVCCGIGAILISMIYKSLWCVAGEPTLGLRVARLETVSFDGRQPTLGQKFTRLFSGYLGVASVGMGIVWALADQEHLSWHDHISQTFLTPLDRDDD